LGVDTIGLNFNFEKGIGQLFFSIKKEKEYYHISTKDWVRIKNSNENDLEILFMVNRK
jgi:hypothetical protein